MEDGYQTKGRTSQTALIRWVGTTFESILKHTGSETSKLVINVPVTLLSIWNLWIVRKLIYFVIQRGKTFLKEKFITFISDY